MSGFETVAITPEQRRKMEECVSMLTMQAPGFVHLMYSCLNHQSEDGEFVMIMSKDVPIAATDSFNIIVNPDTFFKLALGEQVFVGAHEIVHNMYFDVDLLHTSQRNGYVLMPDGRKLPLDVDAMQRAMDARINALLIESKIGKPPAIGWFDKLVKGGDSVYPIYERYLGAQGGNGGQPGNKGNPGGQGQQPQPGNGNPNNGFDKLLKPGEATGKDKGNAKQDKDKWGVEIEAAKKLEEIAAGQGSMPAGMEKMFKELLEPEVSWLDHIPEVIKRMVGDGAVDWHSPHPWYGDDDTGQWFYPDDSGWGTGWIVVWGDTSGSVFDDETQARNIGELAGFIEQAKPKRLTLIWCDASIKEGSVIELSEANDLRDLKPVGGGGTSYKPVLDWIAKNNRGEVPDLFIGFTDGYVSFPDKPHGFPTIWASSTKEGVVKYPFGNVVYINKIRRRDA